MLAPPELRRVHPLGKAPVVTDGDRVLAESGAIIDYLVRHPGGGRLMPAEGTPEQLRYNYFLHYAEGSAMPPLLLKLIFDKVGSSDVPFFVKPVVKGIVQKVNQAFIGTSDVWAISPWLLLGVAALALVTAWVTLWRYLRV